MTQTQPTNATANGATNLVASRGSRRGTACHGAVVGTYSVTLSDSETGLISFYNFPTVEMAIERVWDWVLRS